MSGQITVVLGNSANRGLPKRYLSIRVYCKKCTNGNQMFDRRFRAGVSIGTGCNLIMVLHDKEKRRVHHLIQVGVRYVDFK